MIRLKTFALFASFFVALPLFGEPRVWTAKDGRTLRGDYVSATDDSVTVKREDGLTVAIPLASLSDADVTWVKNQPKPRVITREEIDKIVARFPRPRHYSNEMQELYDRYESMVKFIRPDTLPANMKMIRSKVEDDVKRLRPIAATNPRGVYYSSAAGPQIVAAQRSLNWLEGSFSRYLDSFDRLMTSTN